MKEITSNARSVRTLLNGQKYNIDYYQREYRWQSRQVIDLIEDLTDAFRQDYDSSHQRSEVQKYRNYFVGSLVTSSGEGEKFIVDGQQRLTTITLLLTYLRHNIDDDDDRSMITTLIHSRKSGVNSYNLNVDERKACMDRLYEDNNPDEYEGDNESARNMINAYNDIAEKIDEVQTTETAINLPYFADWLIDNVYLVEISATNEADAYVIFRTMNDRGLSLTSTELLQGFVLSNVEPRSKRKNVTGRWKKVVAGLRALDRRADDEMIVAWLRGRYAESIRQGRKGAEPGDFELISPEFHRWVMVNIRRMNLTSHDRFADFVRVDFAFYAKWYVFIREQSEKYSDEFAAVYCNGRHNFTLQYATILAALSPTDAEHVVHSKIRIVSSTLDAMIARYIWNGRSIAYNHVHERVFRELILGVRENSHSPYQLLDFCVSYIEGLVDEFGVVELSLNQGNKKKLHYLLARLIAFVESSCGEKPQFESYVEADSDNPYEIEHILSQSHAGDFGDDQEFARVRDRIGGLLLIRKSDNANLGDKRFEVKRDVYGNLNLLLTKSLHKDVYERPKFRNLVASTKLPFRPYDVFNPNAINERQELYRQLAMRIWSTDSIREAAGIA